MSTFGPVYEAKHDGVRIDRQHERIKSLMLDGNWRTLNDIAQETKDPVASISAQLRHLRKPKFGGFIVNRRSVGDRTRGLYEYRVLKCL